MRTSDSTVELVKALVAARPAFKPVIRDAIGQVGSDRTYRYADLAGLLEAVQPALTAHGLVVLQAVDAETATLITRVAHVSGEWAEAAYPLKLDLAPQAFGSSLTYGRRYSLQSLLCLATEDDDGAGAQHPPPKPTKSKAAPAPPAPKGEAISQAQRKRMFAIAAAAGWTTEQMKDHLRLAYNIESSKDLLVSSYDQVVADFERPPVAAADTIPF